MPRLCFKCGVQGHYARECHELSIQKCRICYNNIERCICNISDHDTELSDAPEAEESNLDEGVLTLEGTNVINAKKQASDEGGSFDLGWSTNKSDIRRKRAQKMNPAANQVNGLAELRGVQKRDPCCSHTERGQGTGNLGTGTLPEKVLGPIQTEVKSSLFLTSLEKMLMILA